MCWSNWPSCSIVAPAWLLKATGPMCKYFVHCVESRRLGAQKWLLKATDPMCKYFVRCVESRRLGVQILHFQEEVDGRLALWAS